VAIPEGELPAYPEAPEQLPPWPGVSLAPQLRGECAAVRRAAVVENDEDYLGLRLRTVITERFKLTQYAGRDAGEGYGELFDLERDPGELHNLYRVAEQASLRAHLRELLLDELIMTDSRTPRRLCHA
jgi:arylsulfatase A-like enzyme